MKKWQIKTCSAALPLLLMAAAGCVAVPVYYLNDDVTMRSILSGACTGVPDGHAVYMKYPLTGLLAVLYRLTNRGHIFVPWFDLFLAGCILLAGAGILANCLEAAQGKQIRVRVAAVLFGALLFAGALLPHYLYMHYTVVAAILAGAALFLWVTGSRKGLPLLLLGLCYLVRSQVFFLALPFLLVAVLDRVLEAVRRRSAEPLVTGGKTAGGQMTDQQAAKSQGPGLRFCLRQQGLPLLILAVMVTVFWGINRISYGSEDWQSYMEYNASRTKLYDYTDFLSTDWYQERYEKLDLSWEQYQVLAHYDTVLDRDIDTEVLNRTVRRIEELRGHVVTYEYLKQCLITYCRYVRYDGRPYSLIWAGGYGILLILLSVKRRWGKLRLRGALAGGRSLIWVYLIAQGRFPERIWLSLYLIEICLLLGMVLRECIHSWEAPIGSRRRWLFMGVIPLGLALMGVVAVGQLMDISRRVDEQQEKQKQWNQLTESLSEREDSLYLMDVFSAVAYAGELYRRDSEQILLLGGWLTRSPLVQQRLAVYDAWDGAQAMRHGQVRLLAAEGRDVSWLEDYLKQRLGEAELRVQEYIVCGEDIEFVVYRLENLDVTHLSTY